MQDLNALVCPPFTHTELRALVKHLSRHVPSDGIVIFHVPLDPTSEHLTALIDAMRVSFTAYKSLFIQPTKHKQLTYYNLKQPAANGVNFIVFNHPDVYPVVFSAFLREYKPKLEAIATELG